MGIQGKRDLSIFLCYVCSRYHCVDDKSGKRYVECRGIDRRGRICRCPEIECVKRRAVVGFERS